MASSSSDPSGFITNPPSTIVKVVNTARGDMNGKLGIVVQYSADRGRYMVHLTEQQTVVAMKPENLVKASYVEQAQAQVQQLSNDPQVRRMLNNLQSKLPAGVTPKHVGIGAAVILFGLVFILGFSRTLMLISFAMIVLMVIGQDLMAGADMKTVMRNAPVRFQTVVRDQMPGGSYIADKPYALAALAALMVVFFVKSMMVSPSSAASRAASEYSASAMPHRSIAAHRNMLEEYYKLGFDDATAQKDFGTSLPPPETPPPTEDPMAPMMDDLPDYPMPPPTNKGFMSKFASISNIMSIMYLGRTAMELGRDADGSWSFPLFRQNLVTLEPWRLGLLGLGVYRLVSSLL